MPARPTVLLICMLLATAAVACVGLRAHGPRHWMECAALLSAQESWIADQQGDHGVWLIPLRHGRPRIVKPPLLVWLDMLAFTGLDPQWFATADLIWRARLVAVGSGLLLLLGTWWIGRTVQDSALGLCAVGVVSAMALFQSQSRMAAYDITFAAFCTLAVALLLWALRPFDAQRAPPGRFWTGSIVSGIVLGAAWLTKGPLAAANMAIAAGALLAIVPGRRRRAIGAVAVALLAALLVAGPWYLLVARQMPQAWSSWLFEWKATGPNTQESWSHYPSELLRRTLPWTIWLVAGLVHPFWNDGEPELRRRRLFPWLWMLGVLLLYSLPGSKAIRYIIPIAAPLGLMIAWVWRDCIVSAERGESTAKTRPMWVPHWVAVTIVSLGFGLYLAMHEQVVAWGLVNKPEVADVPWIVAVAITPFMFALAVAGWRWHASGRVGLAFLATWAWSMIALAALHLGQSRLVDPMGFIVNEAAAVRAAVGPDVGEGRLVQLRIPDTRLEQEFILYLRQAIERKRLQDVRELAVHSDAMVYLAAPDEPQVTAEVRAALPHAEDVLHFRDGSERDWVLWGVMGSQ